MSNEEKLSDEDLMVLLPIYYKRLFPTYLMCKWLGYSEVPKEYFHRREFSFTLKDDIYLRYQTYTETNDLEKDLVKKAPIKIDIGGVYNNIPKDSKNWIHGVLVVEERELVFDIDMTDYDDVRSCCSGASICENCWPLMQFAIKIVDKALEEDFGFEHRLWIYSGRRGIHCWVSDEVARKLNSQARSAIAEYLTVVRGGDSVAKKVNLNYSLHPSLK
jgi:DNA primase small subunit